MKDFLINKWKINKIITDKKLLEAFRKIPREYFVHSSAINQTYEDVPLPVGYGQTISQPTTIMIMTQALELKPDDKVLEVGTGSGYQSALISKIVKGPVFSVEIIPELVELAKSNLKQANIKNIKVVKSDGGIGFKKEAPFDKIIVTAACPKIPEKLLEQLKIGGIIIAPVGSLYFQKMLKIKKQKKGIKIKDLGNFIFVPLTGEFGFD